MTEQLFFNAFYDDLLNVHFLCLANLRFCFKYKECKALVGNFLLIYFKRPWYCGYYIIFAFLYEKTN